MRILPKRPLGSSGLELSILGLGTVKLGRNQAVKYPSGFELPSDREARNLLASARELGINLLDTAPAYGSSEERLGSLLQGQRHDWIISTKVGEDFIAGNSTFDFSYSHTIASIERSLRRLRTDHLDIVLVHSDGRDSEIIEEGSVFRALEDLRAAGKIRAFGMSTKSVAGALKAMEVCDCLMVTWNLSHHEEVPVIDACLQEKKGILIKKALASGHNIKSETGNPVEEAFSMIYGHPGVTSAIVGTINSQHLKADAEAALNATLGAIDDCD